MHRIPYFLAAATQAPVNPAAPFVSAKFYPVVAGFGVLIAYLITRPDELRSMRLSQFILIPLAMILCVAGNKASVVGIAFLAFLVSPNVTFFLGVGLSNFLDPMDWTPLEEEIALRPIRLLIDRGNYREALAALEELLKKHKPTYEAILLKAKLLHHIGRVDETVAVLPGLIALSNGPAQQLSVMELLDFLEKDHQDPPQPAVPGTRRVEIDHELVLFQLSDDDSKRHKEIPPGTYNIEETIHRNRRWLKLAGEDWGNAEVWWDALLASNRPPAPTPKKGLLWQIARMQQSLTIAIKGKPRQQLKAESQQLFHEAKQFIRQDDWQKAVPLLQKASAADPDRYEIAYRWMLAVRHTANDDVTARAVDQVLQQSQWSKDEQEMLNQVKRPLAR
jgi:tetratricopeptide (TPR) repeat protein